jgi:hypothetical protein
MLAGPAPADKSRAQTPGRARHPVATLLSEVAERSSITHLRVQTQDELVEWRRAT